MAATTGAFFSQSWLYKMVIDKAKLWHYWLQIKMCTKLFFLLVQIRTCTAFKQGMDDTITFSIWQKNQKPYHISKEQAILMLVRFKLYLREGTYWAASLGFTASFWEEFHSVRAALKTYHAILSINILRQLHCTIYWNALFHIYTIPLPRWFLHIL